MVNVEIRAQERKVGVYSEISPLGHKVNEVAVYRGMGKEMEVKWTGTVYEQVGIKYLDGNLNPNDARLVARLRAKLKR